MTASILDQKITYVKGIGPSKGELLQAEFGFKIVRDLLFDIPIRYIDRRRFHRICDLTFEGDVVQIKGILVSIFLIGGGRKKRLTGMFKDATGSLELVWFKGVNWLHENLKAGKEYIIFGRVSIFKGKISMAHPEMELHSPGKSRPISSFAPVYRSTEKLNARGLDSRSRRKIMHDLIHSLKPAMLPEPLPQPLLDEYRFSSFYKAVKDIHFPSDTQSLKEAERRLRFEELLMIQLNIVHHMNRRKAFIKGFVFPEIGNHFNRFYHDFLPFELTDAQKRVLKEIRKDLGSGIQMNRLLQGDVGSGKTIVALMTMFIALDNGYQACMMAPTEILAQQHHKTIIRLTRGMGLRISILTGTVKGRTRQQLLNLLRKGDLHMLIGTHALIEEGVIFKNLGLAIIDEQHRFGVAQRAKLWHKGVTNYPHILVMTATPIPRTLHMTIYGDLDISIIDELPPGRKPIKTLHKTEYHRPQIIRFMKDQIGSGRQIYIVYPLIEESEKLDLEDLNNGYERLLADFTPPQFQISVVHGRMKQEDKDFEMNRFLKGKTNIMVATTVIEVGVDIPNATVMIIENSERFGLSQLHQLRGRVGRGGDQSFCILMSSYQLSDDAKQRIRTMVHTTDGFEIAEMDLRLRGPGSIEGTRQSGLPELKIANLIRDSAILKIARNQAFKILDEDPELALPQNRALKNYLTKYYPISKSWSKIS